MGRKKSSKNIKLKKNSKNADIIVLEGEYKLGMFFWDSASKKWRFYDWQ